MKTVLITGVTRGIGKALAEKYLEEGYIVIGTIRDGISDIQNENLKVFTLDLSKQDSIDDCVKQIEDQKIKIDILINNAGVLIDEGETKVVTDYLRQTLEVNLIGTIDFTEKIIPFINASGYIVNITSTAGSLSLEDVAEGHHPYHYPAYKISKAALNMYTRTLALRLKESGVKVISVHPGWVKTEMGGDDADMTTEDAALGIYSTIADNPDTNQFLFKGGSIPW